MSEENKARSSYLDLDEIQQAFDKWVDLELAWNDSLPESFTGRGYNRGIIAAMVALAGILRAQACSRDANYYAAVEQGKP